MAFGSAWFSYSATAFSSRVSWLRSEEHTSELQSRPHLVCRLLLEKKASSSEFLQLLFLLLPPPPRSTLFPYTTLFRSYRRSPARSNRYCRSGFFRWVCAPRNRKAGFAWLSDRPGFHTRPQPFPAGFRGC